MVAKRTFQDRDNPLRIQVDGISDSGLELDESLGAEWLGETLGDDGPYRTDGDGHITARLLVADEAVHVRGRFVVKLNASCSRCLGPANLTVDTPFELALFASGSVPAADEEGELRAEDMGAGVYSDDVIDLRDLVRDELFLQLPMNPLCSTGCKGLCSQCGTDLNKESCECPPEVDVRWQGLAGIKLD